jgi:hypothetical protein
VAAPTPIESRKVDKPARRDGNAVTAASSSFFISRRDAWLLKSRHEGQELSKIKHSLDQPPSEVLD